MNYYTDNLIYLTILNKEIILKILWDGEEMNGGSVPSFDGKKVYFFIFI